MSTRTPLKVVFAAVVLVGGCASTTNTTKSTATAKADGESWVAPNSDDGVKDPKLAALLRDYWTWKMTESPRWATQLGIHRFDDRVGDRSQAAIEKSRAQNKVWLERAKGLTGLEGSDGVTQTLLVESLSNSIASDVCAFEEWTINPRSNPVTEWNYLPELHTVKTVEDGQNLVARYRAIAGTIDASTAALGRGAKKGLYANSESTRRVVKMVEDQLAQPIADWPLMRPTKAEHAVCGQECEDGQWPQDKLTAYRGDISKIVENEIKPALERYVKFVKTDVLPKARGEDAPGLTTLPMGKACYAARIRSYTNLDRNAQQIHELGLSEIARINKQMRELGNKLFGTDDLPKILTKLRTDEALYFDTEEAVENKAKTALALAKERMVDWFGVLPKADCKVTRIPDYEAPYTTIAYYRQPVPDGSKPGEYFINVYQPKTRPRYEAEALAFHEAIPGHHLQIAISQELPALPAFRKHTGMTAFVEGWALYTERLSDEMGLYSGDLDRMGMLSYEAWRASRLVVDTGIHAMGWSRERAVKFMLEHTALAENNIRNEVDRYITWPGQAVAYKTGQLEIFRLRKWAKDELGDKFDIKGFHDAVLGGGAVTLSIMEDRIKAWVASVK